jgi:hypothetical protein
LILACIETLDGETRFWPVRENPNNVYFRFFSAAD